MSEKLFLALLTNAKIVFRSIFLVLLSRPAKDFRIVPVFLSGFFSISLKVAVSVSDKRAKTSFVNSRL